MTWSLDGKDVIEASFQDQYTIRLRGSIPLDLYTDQTYTGGNYYHLIPPPDTDSRPAIEWTSIGLRPLRLTAAVGKFETVNEETWESGRITISGDDGDKGEWELVIYELELSPSPSNEIEVDGKASWPDIIARKAAVPFTEVCQAAESEFLQYATQCCPWRGDAGELSSTELLACYVNFTSTVRAEGFLQRESVLMSKLWMNKVWSWDNCFNCLALSPLSINTAYDQMILPFDHQLPDGRIPDSVMATELALDFNKPPIYGWTMLKLARGGSRESLSDSQMVEAYRKIAAFSRYWLLHRRTVESALPWYKHGNDSGWDNSTDFDVSRTVVTADLAAHLAVQLDFLAHVSGRLDPATQDYWSSARDSLIKNVVDELWDGEEFVVLNVHSGKKYRTSSLLNLIPLVAAKLLPKEIVDKMAANLGRYLTEWGLATEAMDSPLHQDDGYWRGPIWAPSTILIESGLRDAGHIDLANEISKRFRRLCIASGFAENYDAASGRPNRDLSYTWSASTYLVLVREAAERGEAV
jgi:glycogen debranching enzyme